MTNTELYVSADYGDTWTAVNGTLNYYYISVSSTGQYQTVVCYPGYIYVSTNYGSSWRQIMLSRLWSFVKVSSSGKYQTACVFGGYVYVSYNYGANWNVKINDTVQTWRSISMTPDGLYQLAVGTNVIAYSNYYDENFTYIFSPSLNYNFCMLYNDNSQIVASTLTSTPGIGSINNI